MPCEPAPPPEAAPFLRLGNAPPRLPILLSVPHSGRDYPDALRGAARLPVTALAALEDRYADLLIDGAVAAGAQAIVARNARAWIDLNRAETDVDADMIDPRPARTAASDGPKVLGGLGLIPRRIAGAGEIWRERLSATDLAIRITGDHRPYHEGVAGALGAIRARHGIAVLIDCHSMPTLSGASPARIVIGDRHGRSTAARFVDCVTAVAQANGLKSARNAPYAGGYTLDRHGRPKAGIHALQIEFDRALYLERTLREPGAGLAQTRALLTAIVEAIAAEATGSATAIAAE